MAYIYMQVLGVLCMIDEGEADWKIAAHSFDKKSP